LNSQSTGEHAYWHYWTALYQKTEFQAYAKKRNRESGTGKSCVRTTRLCDLGTFKLGNQLGKFPFVIKTDFIKKLKSIPFS